MKVASFAKSLTASFTEETYLKIKEITDRKRISMDEWLRMAAERAIDNEEYSELLNKGDVRE